MVGGPGGGGGDWVWIASVQGTGAETSLTFSAIPQTYRTLALVGTAQNDGSGSSAIPSLMLRCNGDTNAAHYLYLNQYTDAASGVNVFGSSTDGGLWLGDVANTSNDGFGKINLHAFIYDYTSTALGKTIDSHAIGRVTATAELWEAGGWWDQLAALTSLTLYFGATTPPKFTSATRFDLYGLSTTPSGGGSNTLARCQLTRTTNLTMAAGSYTTVQWDLEREDASGLHSVGTNPDRVTVAEAGLYLLEGRFRFHRVTGTTTSQRIWSAFFKNDTVTIGSEDWFSIGQASSTTGPDESQFSMVATHRLAAGDYVNVQMANEGNGTVDLVVGAADNQTCEFVVTRIGG
jgi:hypothetical protein